MKKINKKFYITTAIPYVNAAPHIGFALEVIQADVLARYHRLKGEDVFFLTGTDENALKNVLAAKEAGMSTKELVDENSARFKELKETLNLSWDDFIRTTEPRHFLGAQKFWLSCKKEDIYKKKYKGLYCVGCEEFKKEKELVSGHCSEHPGLDIEIVEEENYFFRLSAYQNRLQNLIESGELKIIPESRNNEVLSFIKQGLEDFSISRSKDRAHNWGIPVPGDESQIMYVWFDALTNYITALGYADNSEKFLNYWQNGDTTLHVIGKGISRFHAIYWPAMLLSAGLNLPKEIFVHGYLTIDGKKISKSLGNVISPYDVVKKCGTDALRYYLLREIPSTEDGDFTYEKFEQRYNGDLAKGLGNLVSRILTLAEKLEDRAILKTFEPKIKEAEKNVEKFIVEFKFNDALNAIWQVVALGDKYVDEKKPWTLSADSTEFREIIGSLLYLISEIGKLLYPFLPETSEKITELVKNKKSDILFPRLN